MSADAKAIRDVLVPADTIVKYVYMDLAGVTELPSSPGEYFALSCRMEAAYCAWEHLIRENSPQAQPENLEKYLDIATLDFIERYGLFALLAKSLIKRLWRWENPADPKGRMRMREIGKRLARAADANKNPEVRRGKGSIDISDFLFRDPCVNELEQLSATWGHSWDHGQSRSKLGDADYVNRLLSRTQFADCPRLSLNRTRFTEFVTQRPDLAEKLERHGACRAGADVQAKDPRITPVEFYYSWIGWIRNISPNTAKRLISSRLSIARKIIYPKSDHRRLRTTPLRKIDKQ
ncbi:MAG TPA: hypothetical protein VK466_14810 [Terriglobales bacterium]|nr:hypothetical protein [Terriglobales bacterium]